MRLHWQILIALILGVVLGRLVYQPAHLPQMRVVELIPEFFFRLLATLGLTDFGEILRDATLTWVQVFTYFADMFLRALKMIIVPLIMASIVSGVAGIASARELGRLSAKSMTYYLSTTVVAILTGMLLVNLIQPGIVNGEPADDLLALAEGAAAAQQVEGQGFGALVGIFLRMIPENPVAAAANGDILALIVFSILLGFFINRVNDPYRTQWKQIFDGLFEIMMKMTQFIIAFIPIGAFALIARTVATTGLEVFGPLGWYFLCVTGALLFHLLVTLPLLVLVLGRMSPLKHFRAFLPAMLTAYTTSTSSGTLPLTMECAEKNAGINKTVSSFVLPLGATVNMNGTALYECVAVIFIGQAYGLDMSFTQQIIIVITATLAAIGTAGVPAAGLVMMAIILNALGWPLEGIALILAVDRPLDMLRTVVNIYGDACGAAIIAASEGEMPTFPQQLRQAVPSPAPAPEPTPEPVRLEHGRR